MIDTKPLTFDAVKFATDAYAYRMERGMNREEFGWQMGCGKASINSYERREALPKLELFYNLCRLMGKEASEYFK